MGHCRGERSESAWRHGGTVLLACCMAASEPRDALSVAGSRNQGEGSDRGSLDPRYGSVGPAIGGGRRGGPPDLGDRQEMGLGTGCHRDFPDGLSARGGTGVVDGRRAKSAAWRCSTSPSAWSISLCMFAGLAWIVPVFFEFRRSQQTITHLNGVLQLHARRSASSLLARRTAIGCCRVCVPA